MLPQLGLSQPVTTPLQVVDTVSPAIIAIHAAPPPNFDTQVLAPLRAVQAAEAAQAALVAQQQAQAAQAAALVTQATQSAPTPVVAATGNCADWLAAAGVADTSDAMLVINHESGCNPYAREPTSGACGVAQELPCGKSGCTWGDGACEVKWMADVYIPGRYGTWAAAWAHEVAFGWY